jgi:hypothetical protein
MHPDFSAAKKKSAQITRANTEFKNPPVMLYVNSTAEHVLLLLP